MSKADEQMPLEIWTDINGNATRTQFKGGAKYIRADECAQLREQNRVLREAFAKTTKGKVTINRYEHGGGRMFVDDGKNRDLIADTYNEGDREFIALCYEAFSKRAALTATSQEGQG